MANGDIQISWNGWHVFIGTGALYREWTLDVDVPPLNALKGQTIVDEGPDFAEERFSLWSANEYISPLGTEAVVARLFDGPIPPWNPPTDVDLQLIEALLKMTGALSLMASQLTRQTEAERQLGALRTKTAEPATSKEPEQSNGLLRLKRGFDYSNTEEHVNVWELLVDAPTVPVTRSDVGGPRHAAKGDELWEEEDEDGLTPFRLKRGKAQVGSPEWWQVRDLFKGLRTDDEEDPDEAPPAELPTKCYWIATADIPDTPVRTGDILVKKHRIIGPTTGFRVIRVPRDYYGQIAEHVDRLEMVDHNPQPWDRDLPMDQRRRKMQGSLRMGYAQFKKGRVKAESAPWMILRPLVSRSITEPIRATSDDHAIFELLSQVGCRMPGRAVR